MVCLPLPNGGVTSAYPPYLAVVVGLQVCAPLPGGSGGITSVCPLPGGSGGKGVAVAAALLLPLSFLLFSILLPFLYHYYSSEFWRGNSNSCACIASTFLSELFP